MKSIPKSDTNSELWANNKYVYHRDGTKQWNYIKQNAIFSEVYSGYKKLYTAHDFSQFSDDAFKAMTIKANGFNGYLISYMVIIAMLLEVCKILLQLPQQATLN